MDLLSIVETEALIDLVSGILDEDILLVKWSDKGCEQITLDNEIVNTLGSAKKALVDSLKVK